MPRRDHVPVDEGLTSGGFSAQSATERYRRVRSAPAGSRVLGALALGAIAVGALAIGALAIGRLSVGRARFRRVEIDELVVRKLRVTDRLQAPATSEPER